jgi:hypothetical protein
MESVSGCGLVWQACPFNSIQEAWRFVSRHPTHGEIRIGTTVAKAKSWYLGQILLKQAEI